jgi:hypothetical protein
MQMTLALGKLALDPLALDPTVNYRLQPEPGKTEKLVRCGAGLSFVPHYNPISGKQEMPGCRKYNGGTCGLTNEACDLPGI